MDNQHQHQHQHLNLPLLSLGEPISAASTTTTAPVDKIASTTLGIASRLLFIVSIGVISIWANNEATKGIVIRVTNDDIKGMPGQRQSDKFFLFYVSNDEATRLVQNSISFATKILYPKTSSSPDQLIDQVDIRLASHNLTRDFVTVYRSFDHRNKFILSISPLIMEFTDFKYSIRKEIQRGMVEILLFDFQTRVPKPLLDGMVEYVSNLAGFGSPNTVYKHRNLSVRCWEDMEPKVIAQFLRYCEGKNEGFIGRLYEAMSRDNWDDHVMNKALGTKGMTLCESFHRSMLKSEGLVALI